MSVYTCAVVFVLLFPSLSRSLSLSLCLAFESSSIHLDVRQVLNYMCAGVVRCFVGSWTLGVSNFMGVAQGPSLGIRTPSLG